MINFSEVQVPVETSYVKPGFWKMAPTKAELVEKEGKVPYLDITFEGTKGKLNDKFFLSEKAVGRLQYLHEGLYEKRLEKSFANNTELAGYFNTLFTKKSVPLNLIVGGEEAANGKTYANLPFTGFITSDDNFEEGAFEPGTARYNEVVKKSTSPASNATVIGNTNASADSAFPWD